VANKSLSPHLHSQSVRQWEAGGGSVRTYRDEVIMEIVSVRGSVY
jgi:hypothetical protein